MDTDKRSRDLTWAFPDDPARHTTRAASFGWGVTRVPAKGTRCPVPGSGARDTACCWRSVSALAGALDHDRYGFGLHGGAVADPEGDVERGVRLKAGRDGRNGVGLREVLRGCGYGEGAGSVAGAWRGMANPKGFRSRFTSITTARAAKRFRPRRATSNVYALAGHRPSVTSGLRIRVRMTVEY